jgi:hypothetical protein
MRPSESRLTRIAKRAHEIYKARGGKNGKALEDWLRAEQEVDADMSRISRDSSDDVAPKSA